MKCLKSMVTVVLTVCCVIGGSSAIFADEKVCEFNPNNGEVKEYAVDEDDYDDVCIEPKTGLLASSNGLYNSLSSSTYKVIGSDDRVEADNKYGTPYYAIARLTITFSNGKVCYGTGYMISNHTMATAGHCLYDDESKCFATSIKADFGVNGNEISFTVPSSRIQTYIYYGGYPNDSRTVERDYGFINYKTNIGFLSGTIGINTSAPSIGQAVSIAGYPGDKSSTCSKMYKATGKISSVTSLRLAYDTDTYGGQSGSPVYYIASDKKAYAYAIHTSSDVNAPKNYGRRLDVGIIGWLSDNGYLN